MMRHYVNFLLLFAFVTLLVTGVMRFVLPFSLATTRVHIISGFGMAVLVGLHLLARPDYFKKMLKRRSESRKVPVPWKLILGPLSLWALIVAAALFSWPPAKEIIDQSYESRNRAIIFRPQEETGSRSVVEGFQTRREGKEGAEIDLEIEWGPEYAETTVFSELFGQAPAQFAVWAEGPNGDLIETFFVSEKSAFAEAVKWDGNYLKRVNILPIWRHRFTLASGVEPDGKIDAYSGATPDHSFSVDDYLADGGKEFYVCVEVNVPNDENEHYHSGQEATASGYSLPGLGQPSVLYSAFINPELDKNYYLLDLVAHGGSSREQAGDGFYNLEKLTTARQIIEKALVRVEFGKSAE